MKKRFAAFFLSILVCAGFAAMENTCAAPVHAQNQLEEKWNALGENEKNGIYELLQKRVDDEIQLLQKMAELGLIDTKSSESIIEKLHNEIIRSREAGELPGIFHHPPAPKEKRN